MNDLQLCKRIAEISGEIVTVKHLSSGPELFYGAEFEDRRPKYNPLTDDALCFQLMVKYAIEVKPPLKGVQKNTKVVWSVFNGVDDFDNYYLYNADTNKAICLAIIEAHKGIK